MNEIRVETPIGTIVAIPINEPSYPGIEVRIYRNGKEAAHSVRIEANLNEDVPFFNLLAWDSWGDPRFHEPYGESDIDKELSV